MSEQIGTEPPREPDEAEPAYGVTDGLVRACESALLEGRYDEVDRLIEPLHASDFADLFEELGPEARSLLIDHVKTRLDPETLTYLDEVVREDILGQLAPEEVAAAITELETAAALADLADVSAEQQAQVPDSLSTSDRALPEAVPSYTEDCAGRLMQRALVTIPTVCSVGTTIADNRKRGGPLPH